MITKIADWMIKVGTEETTSGNYCIYSPEIAREFNVSEQWVIEHQDDICCEIDGRVEIISETWTSKSDGMIVFDMNFGTSYCKNVEDEEEE